MTPTGRKVAAHRLDVHILDYLKKRNLVETAAAFKKECQISEKPRGKGLHSNSQTTHKVAYPAGLFAAAVDTTSGFLFEWWSIFWEIYVARTNPSYSQYAHTYAQVGMCMSLQVHAISVSVRCFMFAMNYKMQAQKAKHPHWHQQQIQQLEAQQAQQQLLQQQMVCVIKICSTCRGTSP